MAYALASSSLPCINRHRNAPRATLSHTRTIPTRLRASPQLLCERNKALSQHTYPVRSRGRRSLRCAASSADDADAEVPAKPDVQLADRTGFTREQVLQCIKDEAPFLTTREAMVNQKFQYTPVMDYPVTSSAAYIMYMLHLQKALPRELPGYKLEVTRTFQPDPDSVIVRWTITWTWDGKPTSAKGASTYKLDREGLVVSVEEATWEIAGESFDSNRFGAAYDFSAAWRPGNVDRTNFDSVSQSMKFAAWEALKDDPNYGGQMTKEELDGLTQQMLYASIGFVGSLIFLFLAIVVKVVSS